MTFGAAASSSATTGALTIARPSGTVRDQVMIAFIAVRPDTATISAPAGWVLVRRTDNPNPGTATSLASYYKIATSSEELNYVWTFTGTTDSVGGIQTFRGGDVARPIEVHGGQNTAGTAHGAPSVTASAAFSMLVTGHALSSSVTWTPPSGLTESFEAANLAVPDPRGLSMEGNHGIKAAAGPTGTLTANAAGEPDVGNAQILVLSPFAPLDASPDAAVDTLAPGDLAGVPDGTTGAPDARADAAVVPDGTTGEPDDRAEAAVNDLGDDTVLDVSPVPQAPKDARSAPDSGLAEDAASVFDEPDEGAGTIRQVNFRVGCACDLGGHQSPAAAPVAALAALALATRRRRSWPKSQSRRSR